MTKATQTATESTTPIVSLVDVSKHYRDGNVLALDNVSLDISAGEFLSITGKSGSGKSTLLNMIGALDRPTSGDIYVQGEQIAGSTNLDQLRSQKVGFVFQSFYLLPNLTALENIQIPMFESKRSPVERTDEAKRLLELVGLSDRASHLPKELSNGQRQRIAIARALANRPALVLADEPTGALDSQSGSDVMDLLCKLNEDTTTLVVVTHDISIANRASRQIQIMDGRIV